MAVYQDLRIYLSPAIALNLGPLHLEPLNPEPRTPLL